MNIVVVGAQWGDEGKGKVIDVLAKDADIIVRYQGGNNAGHTVVSDDEEFVFHLIPSGLLHPGKIGVIGNGVVVDPEALLEEVQRLSLAYARDPRRGIPRPGAEGQAQGLNVQQTLKLSDQAHLIFPYHKRLDVAEEKARSSSGSAVQGGGGRIGTTGRGIGPCYVDKVARCGIRVADLYDEAVFERKLRQNVDEKNRLLTAIYHESPVEFDPLRGQYRQFAKAIEPFVTNTTRFLHEAMVRKQRLLFEGAQGTLLDIDHGTYPYVTSSNATAGGACVGAGVPPTCIDRVIGVVKAYTTRVGEGPLPTEFAAELMQHIRARGNEFGATTGRPRRCGWFDAVIARHAVQVNGCDAMVVTKLDVLDEMPTIQLCTAYEINGRRLADFPSNIASLDRAKPIYESLPGWQSDTTQAEQFDDLPHAAQAYLHRIEELLGVKICLISIGSKREQAFRVGQW
ncbi:MAG: adenylosuccinate synthase [Candidatus Omnitrophica bacterium]|nr:adenylosuccinate synthase [Candidatus Omnitrophota bacterium]